MQLKFRLLALFAIAAMFVTASSVVAQEKESTAVNLVGVWAVNFEKSVDLSDEEKAEMKGMNITMTFEEDGKLIMSMSGRDMEGEYALDAVEGEEKKFKLTITRGGNESPAELTVLGADEIKIAPEDDQALVFNRQKKGKESDDKKVGADDKMEAGDAKEMSMDEIKKMAIGSWKVDDDATRNFEGNKDKEIESIPPLAITMKDDGTAKIGEGSGEPMEGTYVIRKMEEGEGLEIATTIEDDERAFEFKVVDKNHFAMRPASESHYFIFKRQK